MVCGANFSNTLPQTTPSPPPFSTPLAVAAVKATGVHRVEDDAVQFAVAVLAVPYPNDIFSVWTYVVALMPQRS